MSRYAWFALAAAGFTAPAARPADAPRYNLVAVVTDDQARWGLGCYGNPEVKTPNMDRLAKEGVKFLNAFTVTPVCSPSRVAYMTGRHGVEFGVTDWIAPTEQGVGLPKDAATWPRALRAAGYKTALVGKWHLGADPHQHPTRNGFGHFYGHIGGGWAPRNPTFEVNGQQTALTGYSSNLVTDEALRWVRENAAGPFALCLHFREPHAPYAPVPPEDAAHYASLDPTIPKEPGLDAAHVKRITREYYGAISAVDRNLGRLLDELDRLKIADRTVVMFTSDHGYNLGHHTLQHKGNGHWIAGGVRGPKRPNMWDTSLRIPLLVRGPVVAKPGTEVAETVANIDTFAGVCGMLGVAPPPGVRGQNFAPLLRGERPAGWSNDLYGAYDLHNGGLAYMRMVRTEKWKLVRHHHALGMDELYDLANDPGETKNLAGAAKGAAPREALQAKLDAWMRQIGDPLAKK